MPQPTTNPQDAKELSQKVESANNRSRNHQK